MPGLLETRGEDGVWSGVDLAALRPHWSMEVLDAFRRERRLREESSSKVGGSLVSRFVMLALVVGSTSLPLGSASC